MVKVYAEDLKHISASLWAEFSSEEIYDVCADALDKLAAQHRMIITVSVEEDDIEENEDELLELQDRTDVGM